MAEVPPHLLDRAKARRAALAGGSVEEAAPATPAPAAAAATSVARTAPEATAPAPTAPAPARAAAKPAVERPATAPRGSTFARMGSVLLMAVVPLWGLFMLSAWARPAVSANSPSALGQSLFTANCSACHLASGAGSDNGGVGRPLYKGEAEKTFPDPIQQIAFIKHGSCSVGAPYGNPDREGGQHVAKGNMPAFASLSTDQLLYIVNYERHRLNTKPFPVNMLAKAGEDASVPASEPLDLAKLEKAIKEITPCP